MVRSLYGLKSAGAGFRNHLAYCMHHLGFLPLPGDQDLCMEKMVRPEDRFEYYAYILIYVDDVVVIHHDADSVLWRIDEYFKLNPS